MDRRRRANQSKKKYMIKHKSLSEFRKDYPEAYDYLRREKKSITYAKNMVGK